MRAILLELVKRMNGCPPLACEVIPWASPVPSFGDPMKSPVATLALNPSYLEFQSYSGKEFDGGERRLHTLRSLELERWEDMETHHPDRILDGCRNYFARNPYNKWFKPLDSIISGTGHSFYSKERPASHLDLVPYATARIWGEISFARQRGMVKCCGDILGLILKESGVKFLVLNGKGVAENFEKLSGTNLQKDRMRTPDKHTIYLYSGEISSLAGVPLGKTVAVRGFNYYIQRAPLTERERSLIREWIGNEFRKPGI